MLLCQLKTKNCEKNDMLNLLVEMNNNSHYTICNGGTNVQIYQVISSR